MDSEVKVFVNEDVTGDRCEPAGLYRSIELDFTDTEVPLYVQRGHP
jgi:hypothetical protein